MLSTIAGAAKEGQKATQNMKKAGQGRSVYVGAENLAGNVDPGQNQVSIVFDTLASGWGSE